MAWFRCRFSSGNFSFVQGSMPMDLYLASNPASISFSFTNWTSVRSRLRRSFSVNADQPMAPGVWTGSCTVVVLVASVDFDFVCACAACRKPVMHKTARNHLLMAGMRFLKESKAMGVGCMARMDVRIGSFLQFKIPAILNMSVEHEVMANDVAIRGDPCGRWGGKSTLVVDPAARFHPNTRERWSKSCRASSAIQP